MTASEFQDESFDVRSAFPGVGLRIRLRVHELLAPQGDRSRSEGCRRISGDRYGCVADPADHMAVANIAVVDRIRGNSKIRRIRYSTSMCCGIRIEAGGYYVLFTEKASDSIDAHGGNLLAVGEDYDPAGMLRTDLLDVLAGRRAIDAGIAEYSVSRLPKIPPPPPPPCPDRKRMKR